MRLATGAALFVIGVAIAFGTGMRLDGAFVQVSMIVLVSVLLISIVFHLKNRTRAPLAVAVLILLLGFARAAGTNGDPARDWQNVPEDGEQVVYRAWVDDDAERAGNGVRLSMRAISVNDAAADFPFTVFASGLSDLTGSGRNSSSYRYGDVYEFGGRFSTATGRFAEDSAGTVFTGVVSLVSTDHGNAIRRSVAAVREVLADNLKSTLGEPASVLARTMLVNDRTGLSDELNLDFRESGTSHILAISGLHVALIGGLAMAAAAAAFGRRGQYYLAVPFIVAWGYATLAGFSPSVTRAAIMFSVMLLARAVGRQNASLPGIGFAAAVMVAINPEILRSLSFQLSFAAITGIALLTPRLISGASRLFPQLHLDDENGNRLVSAAVSGLAVSTAATLVTWPLIAVNFGEAPIWGGVATIVLLPAVPLLIIISAISAVATSVSPQIGDVVGWPAWLLGEYIVGVARFFRDLPPGAINTEGWSAATAVVAYGAVFVAFSWSTVQAWSRRAITFLRGISSKPLSERAFVRSGVPAWTVLAAVIIAAVAWTGAATATGSGDLSVTFFETDRGDMILVRTPNGNTALIDGGRDPFGAVRSLDGTLPFWDRSLDLLLVTHPDADHIGGLEAVVERYDVGTIAEMPAEHSSTVYAAWRRSVAERDDAVVLQPGTIIGLDDGVTLEVLAGGRPFPDATINDASIVTMLRYGDFSMLLTGDITAAVERRLLDSGRDLRATVLKVPHHGSDTSSTQVFIDAVHPAVAVIQVGTDNQFGHPTDAVMARLESVVPEENLFVTNRDGAVTVSTDGKKLRVEADGN